jgi:hypothetical protein
MTTATVSPPHGKARPTFPIPPIRRLWPEDVFQGEWEDPNDPRRLSLEHWLDATFAGYPDAGEVFGQILRAEVRRVTRDGRDTLFSFGLSKPIEKQTGVWNRAAERFAKRFGCVAGLDWFMYEADVRGLEQIRESQSV